MSASRPYGPMPRCSVERVRELFVYDPATGVMTRRVRCGKSLPGETFGTVNGRGYLVGMVDYRLYLVHHLAWLYVFGVWPPRLDHRDTDCGNNRISNLREATARQNEANKGLTKANTSGFKGVTRRKANSYRATIKINGRATHLGYRTSPEEAFELYKEAAIRHYGEFARFN